MPPIQGTQVKKLGSFATITIEKIAFVQVRIAEVLAVGTALILVYGVVLRYFFRQGVRWSIEIPSWMLLVLVALTLAYSQSQRKHPRVDLLFNRLGAKWQNTLTIFSHVAFLGLAIIYLRTGIITLVHDWLTISELTKLPVAPVLIVLCIGLVTLALQLVVDVSKAVAAFKGEKGG